VETPHRSSYDNKVELFPTEKSTREDLIRNKQQRGQRQTSSRLRRLREQESQWLSLLWFDQKSTMSLPAFSPKSLQSKVSCRPSLDCSFSSLLSRSPRRSNLNSSSNSSFSSLQERLVSRNYDKLDEDCFDRSLMLEEITNGSIDFDCCQGNSAGTLPTVVDPPSDEEASLDDKESVHSSALCHPSSMEGLVRVMINTKDPTCATIWVNSPNSARQHLELNITPTTPKAKQRSKVRRNAIRRPPSKSLVVPF
jgi:hypothetical protein